MENGVYRDIQRYNTKDKILKSSTELPHMSIKKKSYLKKYLKHGGSAVQERTKISGGFQPLPVFEKWRTETTTQTM